MTKQRPAWVKDVRAFTYFALLDAVLCCMGIRLFNGGSTGQSGDVWMWFFAFPYKAAVHLGWDTFTRIPLLFVSPIFYGLTWWGVWRASRLFRAKPAE